MRPVHRAGLGALKTRAAPVAGRLGQESGGRPRRLRQAAACRLGPLPLPCAL